jgi:hypothetical protein
VFCVCNVFFFFLKNKENERREQWRKENVRRRHNYIPFIMGLLELLAKKGDVGRLIDEAKSKQSERQAAKKERKQNDDDDDGDDE